jgi:hypothetical protein
MSHLLLDDALLAAHCHESINEPEPYHPTRHLRPNLQLSNSKQEDGGLSAV